MSQKSGKVLGFWLFAYSPEGKITERKCFLYKKSWKIPTPPPQIPETNVQAKNKKKVGIFCKITKWDIVQCSLHTQIK